MLIISLCILLIILFRLDLESFAFTCKKPMPSRAIKVTREAVDAYNAIYSKSAYRFVVLGFNDDYSNIELKNIGSKDQTFEDLLEIIPESEARYIFYDCGYKTTLGTTRKKLLCVSWVSSEKCPSKEKMLICSTMNEIKSKCKNYANACTINDWSDLTEENFINIVSENRSI